MTMTASPTGTRPRRSTLDQATALRLAATEYERYLDLLRSLARDDWNRPTACPPWDVRSLASHNLAMAEMAGSLPELVRQFAGAARREEVGVDAMTAHQVETRRGMAPAEITDRYAEVISRAVRGRRRRSALIGRLTMPEKQVVDGAEEQWTFGYLFETILTRDTWMHRIDTTEATGRPLVLTHGARRRAGRRPGDGVGGAARCAVHVGAVRPVRGSLVGRDRRRRAQPGRGGVRPHGVGPGTGKRLVGRAGPVLGGFYPSCQNLVESWLNQILTTRHHAAP